MAQKRIKRKGNLLVGLSLATGLIGLLIAGPILGIIAIILGNKGIKVNRTPNLGKFGIFFGILDFFFYIGFQIAYYTQNFILGLVIVIIGVIIGIIVLIALLRKKKSN